MRYNEKIIIVTLLALLLTIQAFGDTPCDSLKVESRDGHPGLPGMSAPETIGIEPRPLLRSLKTNMLYDAALIPNISVEFIPCPQLSVYGEWMYAWWKSDRHKRYWQVYGGDIGARWWFGKESDAHPFAGHHLGICGGALIFDFELGDKGYMGGRPGGKLWDRCIVNTGIEYGYSLQVGRRLNIDFSIGIGYLGGKYIKYFPFDNEYFREKEYNLRYFGPTKAEISLVWLIGRGNTNPRKGGDV